jgi:hypothetical protein
MTTKKQPRSAQSAPEAQTDPKKRRCKWKPCGKLFTPNKPDQIFHDRKCRYQFHKLGEGYGTLAKAGVRLLVKHASDELVKRLPTLERRYFAKQAKQLASMERELKHTREALTEMRLKHEKWITQVANAVADVANKSSDIFAVLNPPKT